MARGKTQVGTREAPVVEAPVVEEAAVEQPPVVETPPVVEEAPIVAEKATVKVYAKFPPFVDLVKDVKIGSEAVEVELHPWLQANISAGLLIVAE